MLSFRGRDVAKVGEDPESFTREEYIPQFAASCLGLILEHLAMQLWEHKPFLHTNFHFGTTDAFAKRHGLDLLAARIEKHVHYFRAQACIHAHLFDANT